MGNRLSHALVAISASAAMTVPGLAGSAQAKAGPRRPARRRGASARPLMSSRHSR
jgi:hypothetical protein